MTRSMRWRAAIVLGPAFVLFGIGATTDIALPGIYMDAVNPDYFVVRLLNPAAADMPAWYQPGTLLFDRLPVLGQIYHGAPTYYVGLPFYALFGTGVVGIRLTNMVFGLLVISGTGAFMLAFGVRPLIGAACLGLLALDPGFLFSFRTQFYTPLLPVAALLASAALAEASRQRPTRWKIAMAGLLAGVACYGYFIYFFLVPPVAALAVYRLRPCTPTGRVVVWWAAGFLVGVAPYALYFLLLLKAAGGPRAFLETLQLTLHALAPQGSTLSVFGRMPYFVMLVRGTILNAGTTAMMLKNTVGLVAPELKTAMLLLVPACAILTGLARPVRIIGMLVLAGMVFGLLMLVVTFGDRIWFQHAALLLPLLYGGLALALQRFASMVGFLRLRTAEVLAGVVAIPLLVANAYDRQAVFLQLQITHGVGLYSDAINHFAEDSLVGSAPPHVFFPDWGVFMPFAMLTHGAIPYSNEFAPASARTILCRGQDAEVVAVAGQPMQRLDDWTAAEGWGHPEIVHYDQRDGTPVLYVMRWHAADRPLQGCP